MELACSCAQMKDENMVQLVQLCPIGAFKLEIFASKDKRAFFLGHPVHVHKCLYLLSIEFLVVCDPTKEEVFEMYPKK